ncbi:MAG: leucyl/phenylalanyl-tRNA--protein transferase [Robiginitomaculum sp.]|nr:MAG: leucyl/phenylalanyl-tRNA--protein transferase [Robiginitomaculum sp.]
MTPNDPPEFGPYELLNCYANGVFPMSEGPDDQGLFLVDPERRGVFPLNGLKISKSLAKIVRSHRFDVRVNTAFAEIVRACGAPERPGAWINTPIVELYTQLHDLGHAHSVECWYAGKLVGGLYGVSLRGAFFGESMFSHMSNASKTALVHLVGRLNAGGFTLLDAQFITPHLRTLGAIDISRDAYHEFLHKALEHEGDFNPPDYLDSTFSNSVRSSSSDGGGGGITQSKTQIS